MFSFSKRKIFDEMTPKIKGKHVLICCTGPSIADYKERIYDLASQEDVIVWGVNNAHPFIDLDVHIWGEWSRWKKFHARVRKESIFLFPPLGKYRKVIAKWDFRSKARTVYYYDYRETGPKEPLRFENFCMHGHFANTGSISIYLSYLLGARKISFTTDSYLVIIYVSLILLNLAHPPQLIGWSQIFFFLHLEKVKHTHTRDKHLNYQI